MIAALGVGSVLAGRYELVRHIARGGMADVYEADDRQLQRAVAIKVFRAGATADRARFDAEVVVLAALNHPGLVQVYDAGEHEGDAFVVLDLVDGPTLAARLAAGGPIPPHEAAEVGAQVADALAYVHDQGVVHRDVTPANVLCSPDGRALLADFGIARLIDTSRVTAAATTVGTAAYMAPEQVQGVDVTPAADVYSLGLVLLELLTGRKAFTGTAQETAVARLVRDPDTSTDVPDAWRDLLRDMTERAPSDRPSAAQVRDRLRAMLLIPTTPTALLGVVGPTTVVAAPDGAAAAPADALTTPAPSAGGTAVMPAALLPSEACTTRAHATDPPRCCCRGPPGHHRPGCGRGRRRRSEPGETAVNHRARRRHQPAHHGTSHHGGPRRAHGKPKDPGPGNGKGNGGKKDNGPGAHDD